MDWLSCRRRPDSITSHGPGGEPRKVRGQPRLQADSIDALHRFTCRNLCATVLPQHLAARGEASGKLVRLPPDWRLIRPGFFAVWPDRSRRESLTRIIVRFIAEWQGE